MMVIIVMKFDTMTVVIVIKSELITVIIAIEFGCMYTICLGHPLPLHSCLMTCNFMLCTSYCIRLLIWLQFVHMLILYKIRHTCQVPWWTEGTEDSQVTGKFIHICSSVRYFSHRIMWVAKHNICCVLYLPIHCPVCLWYDVTIIIVVGTFSTKCCRS